MGFTRFFCEELFHRCQVQHLISDNPLELRILGLEVLEASRLRRLHTAELLTPGVKRRLTDTVAPTEFVRLRSGLGLVKNANDLLFGETAALHDLFSFVSLTRRDSSAKWPGKRGKGQYVTVVLLSRLAVHGVLGFVQTLPLFA